MKRTEIAISASLLPIDYLMVFLAGITSYYIRYWEPIKEIRPIIFDLPFSFFFQFIIAISLIWLFSFWLSGLYSMSSIRRTLDEISKIILGCSTAVMILMFIFFFSRSLFDSRFIILAGWLFSIIYVIIGRSLVRLFQHSLYKYNLGVHRLVVIGKNDLSAEVKEIFNNQIKYGYKVVAEFENFNDKTKAEMEKMIAEDRFDEVLIATGNLSSEELNNLNDFSYIYHTTLKYVADIFDFPITNFEITNVSGIPIVELKKTKLDGWGRIYKRLFDIVGSTILIIILSPILLAVAIAIKLNSKGPVFFKYNRIGENGKTFTYIKFRSMIKDAHKFRFDPEFIKKHKNLRDGTPMMKFENDPRVTSVGRFIRKTSIDELPELFNVFIGKMSLVGPRPHEVEEVARYENFHKKVLTIKPGITGMAQVSGRSDLDFNEEVRLDVGYMENWSFKLDLMILFKTPFAVLKKRKAD
ncbi:MAG: sugar transferase [Candidatus Buchananbacteria bacterium]